jgi:hypothetical protein
MRAIVMLSQREITPASSPSARGADIVTWSAESTHRKTFGQRQKLASCSREPHTTENGKLIKSRESTGNRGTAMP